MIQMCKRRWKSWSSCTESGLQVYALMHCPPLVSLLKYRNRGEQPDHYKDCNGASCYCNANVSRCCQYTNSIRKECYRQPGRGDARYDTGRESWCNWAIYSCERFQYATSSLRCTPQDLYTVRRSDYDGIILDLKNSTITEYRPTKTSDIFGNGNDKSAVFLERYHLIKQRLLRNNENFDPASMHIHGSGAFQKITPIKGLIGHDNERFLLFGMLTCMDDGKIYLEDDDGHIQLDLSNCVRVFSWCKIIQRFTNAFADIWTRIIHWNYICDCRRSFWRWPYLPRRRN